MAKTTKSDNKKDLYKTALLIAVPLISLVAFGIIIFALAGDSGAVANDPINSAPGSADLASLNSLEAFTHPSDFLHKNAGELDDLIKQANAKLQNISQVKPADRANAQTLLTNVVKELQQLKQNLATNNTAASTDVANQLAKDIANLNSIFPAAGAQLNVPVVIQGSPYWCGYTSMDMIMLYYNHGKIPAGMEGGFGTNSDGTLSSNKDLGVNGPSPELLNRYAGVSDFTRIQPSQAKSATEIFQNIKASIDGGDPVLMYTNGVYYPIKPKYGHIVVITGYDEATQTIVANNPIISSQGGTRKNVRTSTNGRQIVTASLIYQHLADTAHGYSDNGGELFIMRSKYWR